MAAEYLYKTFPGTDEGELTTLRSALVRAETLAGVASGYGIGDFLLLGRGEAASGGRARQTVLSAALEALVGAAYLDRGLAVTRSFILRFLKPELQRVQVNQLAKDYKSRLQELAQAKLQQTPTYRTVSEVGPDHAKLFTVEILLGGVPIALGEGRSKQQAQQNAAKNALEAWGD